MSLHTSPINLIDLIDFELQIGDTRIKLNEQIVHNK